MSAAEIVLRDFYLQNYGIPLTIVPSYVTEWFTKARSRELGGENRIGHFEENS